MSSEICKYYLQGRCTFKHKCRNEHPLLHKQPGNCQECDKKGYHADCWHCKGTGIETTECTYFNSPRGCLKKDCPFLHIKREGYMSLEEIFPSPLQFVTNKSPVTKYGQITIEYSQPNTASSSIAGEFNTIPDSRAGTFPWIS